MATMVEDADNVSPIPDTTSDQRYSAPPESSTSVWSRRRILLAFWAVVVALGLPHWLWTTSIHRSNLPLESMNSWADGKACLLQYPLYIDLVQPEAIPRDSHNLAEQIEELLNNQDDPLYRFYVTTEGTRQPDSSSLQHGNSSFPSSAESALAVHIQSDSKAKSTSASLRSWAPILDVKHNPSRSVDAATLPAFIVNEIRKVFDDERRSVRYLLDESPFGAYQQGISLSPEEKVSLDARSTRAFKYASTYHLTFSLFTSMGSPSSWEIEEVMEETINPLLRRLSPISQFTVDTQVQLFATFSPSIAGPQYDTSTQEWKLLKSDLTGFINAAEWPLSPSIGSGPTINFVLYVPSKDQSPLVLAETGGKSWLIPQWGGVQILNPTGKQPELLTVNDLRPVMLTFADQLSLLLGLPQSPPSLVLRISSLTRERATSLIISASSTLGALARLTLKLTSISIPDSVAKSVDETIHRLDQSCEDIRKGHYLSALENARTAEGEAEQAFFEPSMVGQVYFPDEHKVAVYVPLLGPMAVPLVMAALKELKKFRHGKAKTA